MYKHILVPIDGSPLATEGLEKSLTFAKVLGASVTILTVSEEFHIFSTGADQLESSRAGYEKYANDRAAAMLAEAAAKANKIDVPVQTRHVINDHPYEAIIATARDNNCDLIAMASHGRGGIAAVVVGSQTMKVLTHSRIPVLVYR